jgi:DNA-binding transcriptional ArsR family regulator
MPEIHRAARGTTMRIDVGAASRARLVFNVAQHAETLGSVRVLRRPTGRAQLDRWRAEVLGGLPRRARPLLDLILPPGPVPDFLAPEEAASQPPHQAARQIVEVPTEVLAAQLGHLPVGGDRWLGRLRVGDRRALGDLAAGIRAYGEECFAGAWSRAHRALTTEVARRREQLRTGGPEAVLSSLGPGIEWREPVLRVRALPDGLVRLDGRALRLVPSAFWTRPFVMAGAYRLPTLGYPIADLHLLDDCPDPLADLLGRTRAAVARTMVVERSTGALAAQLGISAASASEHARVLRAAGLAATARRGRAVAHTLTPAGLHLVLAAAEHR